MNVTIDDNSQLSLVFDLLADIVLLSIARQERISAPLEVREAVLYIMELEMEELMDYENIVDLLGSDEFRVVA